MELENDLKLGKVETFDLVIAQSARAVIDVLISNTVKDESIVSAETKEEKSDDLQSPLEQPKILEGKRSRKPISRLDLSSLTPSKKEVSIPQGRGKPLGDIEHINQRLNHAATDTLSRMGQICFGRRRGLKKGVKKHLRLFRGFDFDFGTDEYQKHLKSLSKLKKDQLKSVAEVLGLSISGRNSEVAERIVNFLLKPTDQTKKKRSVRKSSIKTTTSTETVSPDLDYDDPMLMNCQVKLDDVVQQSDLILPTETEVETDLSERPLVIDESVQITNDFNPEMNF